MKTKLDCRRISAEKGCLYPGDAAGLYWLLDALRLALAASRDEAEKAKAEHCFGFHWIMAHCTEAVEMYEEHIEGYNTPQPPVTTEEAVIADLEAKLANLAAECESLRAENRDLREALSKFFDQADEENFAPTKDCFVHCEGCDPSFDCWRHSDGCRKTLATKEGKA